MQKATSFNNVAIASIKGNDSIHFWYLSKNDAIALMNNSSSNKKTVLLKILLHIKDE